MHNIVSAGNTGEFYHHDARRDRAHAMRSRRRPPPARRSSRPASAARCVEATSTGKAAAKAGCDAVMVHLPLDPFAAPHRAGRLFHRHRRGVARPLVAYVRSDAIGVKDLVRSRPIRTSPASNSPRPTSCCSPNASAPARAPARPGSAALPKAGRRRSSRSARAASPPASSMSHPGRSLAILTGARKGDYAEARAPRRARSPRFEHMRTKHNNGANVTVVKEAIGLLGTPVGPVRLPGLPELNDAREGGTAPHRLRLGRPARSGGIYRRRHSRPKRDVEPRLRTRRHWSFALRSGPGPHLTQLAPAARSEHQEVEETPMTTLPQDARTAAQPRAGSARTTCAPSGIARAPMQMGFAPRGFRRQAGDRHHQHLVARSIPATPICASRADEVKRGVWQAGGFPVETAGDVAVGEPYHEADHHALPQPPGDGDRGAAARAPDRRRGAARRLRQDHAGLLMGAHQHGLPAIFVPAGPMLRGNWRGKMLGSGSDVWKYWAEKQAGNITDDAVARHGRAASRAPSAPA